MVASNPSAYDRFYNVIANPILWFIQHYLWDLSNAPDIRQAEVDAWEEGYKVVNDDMADCVIRSIEGQEDPVVMLHDYHLYTCPGLIRRARPEPSSTTSSTSPGPSRTPGGSSRTAGARRSTRACWPTTSSASHERLLPQLPAVLPGADGAGGRLRADGGELRGPRDLGARLSAFDRHPAPLPGGGVLGRRVLREEVCASAATT